ncbi:unnamed protein product [Echinostoma caproni]|uniref:Uncharacterized protein n=1 Tax=Echinostoma caproni TaxID=27848 RepID=A0A183B1J6_9TREM|nr:unnamed protein product [Echinostoma caproni]
MKWSKLGEQYGEKTTENFTLAGHSGSKEQNSYNPTQEVQTSGYPPGKSVVTSTSLFKLQAFLDALVTCEDDARIVIHPVQRSVSMASASVSTPPGTLYFTVLDPGRYLHG